METNLDMLACTKSEDGLVTGEKEGVSACVGGDLLAVDELDGHPAVFLERNFAVVACGGGLFFGGCFCVFLYKLGGLFGYYSKAALL